MVTPIPIHRSTLTGTVRGRPRRFGLPGLIMQVEVRIEAIDAFAALRTPAPPACSAEEWKAWDARETDRVENAWRFLRTEWRDATWQDQYELAINDATAISRFGGTT